MSNNLQSPLIYLNTSNNINSPSSLIDINVPVMSIFSPIEKKLKNQNKNLFIHLKIKVLEK
jgi:hypothetical protein